MLVGYTYAYHGWYGMCKKKLKEIYPNIKIVLLSAYEDEESIERVLSVCADGYILKSSSLDEFKETLRFIIDGKFVAPQKKWSIILPKG